MSSLDPVILNEVKLTQKAIEGLTGSSSSGPTEYPWRVFTSSGSFVVPSDGDYYIIVVGGGGGGVGMTPNYGMSGGHGGGGGASYKSGGGGGVSIRQSVSLLAGSTLTVTVGAGGASGGGWGDLICFRSSINVVRGWGCRR